MACVTHGRTSSDFEAHIAAFGATAVPSDEMRDNDRQNGVRSWRFQINGIRYLAKITPWKYCSLEAAGNIQRDVERYIQHELDFTFSHGNRPFQTVFKGGADGEDITIMVTPGPGPVTVVTFVIDALYQEWFNSP
mgnify:CR=1 FL=1